MGISSSKPDTHNNFHYTITDPINALIQALNKYISDNVDENNIREHQKLFSFLISHIYSVFPLSERQNIFLLNFTQKKIDTKHCFPYIEPKQLSHLTIRQLMDTIERIHDSITTAEFPVSYYELRNKFDEGIKQSKLILNWLKEDLIRNKEQNQKKAEENKKDNQKNILYRTPPDILQHMFDYAGETQTVNILHTCRLFKEKIATDQYWINKIKNKFGLDENEVKQYKHEKETYGRYYLRIDRIRVLCETERAKKSEKDEQENLDLDGPQDNPASHNQISAEKKAALIIKLASQKSFVENIHHTTLVRKMK